MGWDELTLSRRLSPGVGQLDAGGREGWCCAGAKIASENKVLQGCKRPLTPLSRLIKDGERYRKFLVHRLAESWRKSRVLVKSLGAATSKSDLPLLRT